MQHYLHQFNFFLHYNFNLNLLWISVEYFYLLLLQVTVYAGSGNLLSQDSSPYDSKEMLTIAYITTAVMLVLGVFTFILPTYFVINEAMFSFGYHASYHHIAGTSLYTQGVLHVGLDCSSRPAGMYKASYCMFK